MLAELEQATNKISTLELELGSATTELKTTLDKQQCKVKHLWQENCDLQLKHKEEVELLQGTEKLRGQKLSFVNRQKNQSEAQQKKLAWDYLTVTIPACIMNNESISPVTR